MTRAFRYRKNYTHLQKILANEPKHRIPTKWFGDSYKKTKIEWNGIYLIKQEQKQNDTT